jgi:hypothetical protein
VSLSCCDALLSMLETGVQWYVLVQELYGHPIRE